MKDLRSYVRVIGWIARKDLKAEWRSREMLSLMFVFGLLVVILMTMASDPSRHEVRPLLAGLLWVSIFFAGMLGLSRSFSGDHAQGGLDVLLLIPVDRSALFLGKALANLLLLFCMESVLTVALFVFAQVPWQGHMTALIFVLIGGGTGFAAAGTFLSGLAAKARAGWTLLPILLFPILIPLALAVVRLSESILQGDPSWGSAWWRMLIAYDVIFVALPLFLFELLIED